MDVYDFDRRLIVDALGRWMSEIREQCYAASWDGGLEDRLPHLVRQAVETGKPQRYGMGEITPDMARQLGRLAEMAGSWAEPSYADDPSPWEYVPYVPHA